MELKRLTLTGKTDTAQVSDALFAEPFNAALLAQAVYVYRTNQRQGGAKALTRGEVDATTKKVYKQKGTGNARHGAKTAPIFVGGGKAHGPTGQENWKRTLSKAMARKATVVALSAQAEKGAVALISQLNAIEAKAKAGSEFLRAAAIAENTKVLIIMENSLESVLRAFQNVTNVTITRADRVNALELAQADQVFVSEEAIVVLAKRLLGETIAILAEKPAKKAPTAKKAAAPKKAPVTKKKTDSEAK